MRILGFSKRWDKLNQIEFTTFRVPRKDRDWEASEMVQIVYHPRSKDHELLGRARVLHKEIMTVSEIKNEEAILDGFPGGKADMWRFLFKSHKGLSLSSRINKLYLRWIQ